MEAKEEIGRLWKTDERGTSSAKCKEENGKTNHNNGSFFVPSLFFPPPTVNSISFEPLPFISRSIPFISNSQTEI
jgi:hypothetical protein